MPSFVITERIKASPYGRKATFSFLFSLFSKSRVDFEEKREERKVKSEEDKKKKPLARLFFLELMVRFELTTC